MTPEERKMLEDLAEKVHKTPSPPADAEAEDFIRKNIGSRPDALYLMTQTVLIQNMALEHAQRQIQEMQEHAGQPASAGTSFLGTAPPAGGGYSQSRYAAQPQTQAPPPPQYAAPSPAPPSPSGAGSFLRGAAQTAAGVAVGALAFEAIGSLFSHPMYGGLGGGYMGAPMGGETIIENNYYDQPQGGQADFQGQGAGQDQTDLQNVDDSGQYDDGSNYDDSTDTDDGGGLDDGGGFDDGGSWT